jgi:hypothetical protein
MKKGVDPKDCEKDSQVLSKSFGSTPFFIVFFFGVIDTSPELPISKIVVVGL